MYALLFRLLRLLPAEAAHRLAFGALRALAWLPGGKGLLRRWFGRGTRDPRLRVRALGLELPGPVGLAAGFDKDGEGPEALGALGFSHVEVGTVTAQAQPGNPRPRLFRLPADRALVNRMGFNNHGAAAAAARLARHAPAAATATARDGLVVGVNIGKTKVVAESDAAADYAAAARAVAPVAAYVAVNVSSPNTPGLRSLQTVDKLEPILRAVRAALDAASGGRRVPLLVKIAPDLADEDVDAVADLALGLGLDGIIATNTTIGRVGLASPPDEVAACGAGGLSGPPVRTRSLEVLRRLRARVGDRLTLVSVGGVSTVDDVWARLAAGATLVQLYTAFVYEGPGLPGRLHRELLARLERAGVPSVTALIGAGDGLGAAAPAITPAA